MSAPLPIIATLIFDREAQARFQRLRDRYYPQAKTPAHVTLFRHLPGKDPDQTAEKLAQLTKGIICFPLQVEPPTSLSNGVALPLISPELIALRAQIADAFAAELKPDDRKPFRPHMTIQNRVTRRRAQRTLGAVRARFEPFPAMVEGIALWTYDLGHWHPLAEIRFEPA